MTFTWVPQFCEQDYQITAVQAIYNGYCSLQKLTVQFSLFQGGMSPPIQRELVLRHPAVAVLLVDVTQRQVVMIEQFRVGACRSKNPWLLEIVAGVIEPGDEPLETARREVLEETGLVVQSLTLIGRYFTTPGLASEEVFLYCGLIQAPITPGIHGQVEEGENIKVHVLSFNDVYALLESGQINSSPALIAVQWLKLNQQSLNGWL